LDRSGRLRRRLLAIWLPITALLYMGTELLNPKGTDQLITTTATALKVLPIAAKHSSQLYLSARSQKSRWRAHRFVFRDRHVGATSRFDARHHRRDSGAVGAFCGVGRKHVRWHQPRCRLTGAPDESPGGAIPHHLIQFPARARHSSTCTCSVSSSHRFLMFVALWRSRPGAALVDDPLRRRF